MLKQRTRKNLLIISLLLHLIVIIFFTFSAFKTKQRFAITTPTKKQAEELRRQAQLRPKRSDEGTQVVFDDRTILPSDPTKTPKPASAKVEKKEVPKPEVPKPPEKIEKKKETPKPHFPEKKIEEPVKKVLEKEPEKPKPITKEDLKKLALANMLKEQHKEISPNQSTPAPQATPAVAKPKKLLSLMKSYIDSENGNSCMIREGENRNPSIEELKYICYEKQTNDLIVSAWKIMHAGEPPLQSGSVKFTFVINEDGSLDELGLIESSGNQLFDKMVLQCIQKAAPFPPIPKHFGVKKYRPHGGTIMLPS